MQSILMAASAAALLHSTMVTSGPLIPDGASTGPMPQNGVWALLPDKCEAPTSLDMTTWAKCATPIGFLDDEVAALERPGPGKKATPDAFYSIARTKFAIVAATPAPTPASTPPGAPDSAPTPPAAAAPEAPAASAPASPVLVAQVVVPMVFSRSYYYLSLTPKALDDAGRFAEAQGWPVACAPKDEGGCNPATLAQVQAQAAVAPTDPQRLYRLIRILPPAPSDATSPPAPAAIPSMQTGPVADTVTETPLPPAKGPPAKPDTAAPPTTIKPSSPAPSP